MGFFKFCNRCKQFFQSEEAWAEHAATHSQKVVERQKPFDQIEAQKTAETPNLNPTGGDFDAENDTRIQKTRKLTAMKKELKKAGIECSTMKEDEVKALYDKFKADEEKKNA